MHFSSAVIFVGSIAVVSASSLFARQSFPACALTCEAQGDFSGCPDHSDNGCLCNSFAFVNSTTTCFEQTCTGDDLTTAIALATELCEKVGVTATPSPPSSSGGASSTVAVSISASTSTTPQSSATSSTLSPSASADGNTQTSSALRRSANVVVGLFFVGFAAFAL